MRLTHIDALRGLTAFLIVLFHLSYCSGIAGADGQHIIYYFLKVEVFYVITGFVLTYGLHKYQYKISYFPGFIAKRLLRLEPAYFATIFVCLILAAMAGHPLPSVKQFLLHIGYLNSVFDEPWIAPIFWTLAIEFQFYVFLGLAYKAFATQNNFLFTAFAAVLMAVAVLVTYFIPSLVFLPRYFGFFLIGVYVFRLSVLKMPIPLYVCLTAATLGVVVYVNGWPHSFTALVTAVSILFVKIEDKGFAGRGLHWLGRISYSLYLIHWPIGVTTVFVLRHVPFLAAMPLVRVAIGTAVSLAGAWALYKLIERPSVNWSRQIKLKSAVQTPKHVRQETPQVLSPVLQHADLPKTHLAGITALACKTQAGQEN